MTVAKKGRKWRFDMKREDSTILEDSTKKEQED